MCQCVCKGQAETDELTHIWLRPQNVCRQKCHARRHTHTHTNMTFQCHLKLLGVALMAWPLRNGSIDRSHTRWNLSICHNLVSCLRLAYKQALIEWSQFTKTKWSCRVMNDTDAQAEEKTQKYCTCIFIKQAAFFVCRVRGGCSRYLRWMDRQ